MVFGFVLVTIVAVIFSVSSTQKWYQENGKQMRLRNEWFFHWTFFFSSESSNAVHCVWSPMFVTCGAKAGKMHFMFENAKQMVVNWKRNWSQRLWQAAEVRNGIYVGCIKIFIFLKFSTDVGWMNRAPSLECREVKLCSCIWLNGLRGWWKEICANSWMSVTWTGVRWLRESGSLKKSWRFAEVSQALHGTSRMPFPTTK